MPPAIETCVLCHQETSDAVRPGLAPVCRECFESEAVQGLLRRAESCMEDYRAGPGECILRILWSWLMLSVAISAILTSLFAAIGLLALMGRGAARPGGIAADLVQILLGIAYFFGAGVAFVSVVALPMALVGVPCSRRQSVRFDSATKSFIKKSGRRERSFPLHSIVASIYPRYFCGDKASLYLPDRTRVTLTSTQSNRKPDFLVCGHTDATWHEWHKLFLVLGIEPQRPRPLRVMAWAFTGGMTGLFVGFTAGQVLSTFTGNGYWPLGTGFLGFVDGCAAGVALCCRDLIATHWKTTREGNPKQETLEVLTGVISGMLIALKSLTGGVPILHAIAVALVNGIGGFLLIRILKRPAPDAAGCPASLHQGSASLHEPPEQ